MHRIDPAINLSFPTCQSMIVTCEAVMEGNSRCRDGGDSVQQPSMDVYSPLARVLRLFEGPIPTNGPTLLRPQRVDGPYS